MSLTNYIKGLLPSFKRDKVLESVASTRQMLIEASIPSYEAAVPLFEDRKFISKQMKEFVNIYNSNAEKVIDSTFLPSILKALNNSVIILDYIGSVSKKEFSDTETNVTLTYKKSTFLRTVQVAEFVSSYSRKFLNFVFVLETSEASEHYTVKDSLVQEEINFLQNNYLAFVDGCRILMITKEKYKHSLDSVPEAVITDMSEMVLPETVGLHKLDPLLMKNISVTWNPFYLVGMAIVQFQVLVYKSAKEEYELLQMRKLHLQNIYNETHDPKVEKQLNYMQDRVDSLQYKIKKMEEDYNV